MKAIVQDRYGSADVLRFRDVDPPEPADDQVLVRVAAASVNAADWHFMRGDPYVARLALGLLRPRRAIRGHDFAGRVERVGRRVRGLRPGEEVFGEADGTFAEYVAVGEGAVARKPANLTFAEAAAVPLAGNTALVCLRDAARVRPGQRVLVNGASGGVGTFAVQLAKAFGARVTGVCRTRNLDLVRSLGADHVVDYTRTDFTREAARYDVVLDLVGNRSLGELRRVLAADGVLVLSGGGVFSGGSLFGPLGLLTRGRVAGRITRLRVLAPVAKASADNLAALRELIESGEVVPTIERTYPLEAAAEAIRHLEGEHARAKVVVTV